MLPKKTMEEKIYPLQRELHDKYRDTSFGETVQYKDLELVVSTGVFHPWNDSRPLVDKYHINPGDKVLDVCTGAGTIAIDAALKGAGSVVALDINPEAIRCAKENARRYGFESVIDARVSDMFSALKPGEMYDVITMNPPFTKHSTSDFAERTVWDEDLKVHRAFFKNVKKYLKKDGRVYISQAEFGAVEEMKEMAIEAGFVVRQIGKYEADEDRVFYAFELTRNEATYALATT